MNALASTFQNIFSPKVKLSDYHAGLLLPLLRRLRDLGPGWHRESDVRSDGLIFIASRGYTARDMGLVEFRPRTFRGGEYWFRLTPFGLRCLRES